MEMNDREESRDDTVEASIARDTWSLQEIQKAAHAVEGQLVHIKEALRSGVEDGTFVKSGNTWKVSDEARKKQRHSKTTSEKQVEKLAKNCAQLGFPVELVIVDEIQLVKVRTGGSRKKGTSSSSSASRSASSSSSSSSSSPSPRAVLVEPEEEDSLQDKIVYTQAHIVNRVKAARKLISSCRKIAQKRGHRMFVLGLSGTPVINSLKEANSLIELVTGKTSGLPTFTESQSYKPENCLAVHRKLMACGLRINPEIEVDP